MGVEAGPVGLGAAAAGTVLAASSARRVVTIALDAAQQAEVKAGDRVTITLPGGQATPGVVSSVGKVATGGSTPTVTVLVTPADPAATGSLDQAPAQVSLTTASVQDALVVPVNALMARASGGYPGGGGRAGGGAPPGPRHPRGFSRPPRPGPGHPPPPPPPPPRAGPPPPPPRPP